MEQNKINNMSSHIVKIICYSAPTNITCMMGENLPYRARYCGENTVQVKHEQMITVYNSPHHHHIFF